MKETYLQARIRILTELKAEGWTVSGDLKIPHATNPEGNLRLWFKAQAVYSTKGNSHDFGSARSLWIDIRNNSTATIVANASFSDGASTY